MNELPKATNKHSQYMTIFLFHCSTCCTNTSQCYVRRTSPVLFRWHVHYYNVLHQNSTHSRL